MNLEFRALLLCLAAASSGCGSGLAGVDKRLGAMQDEITKLQSQNDRLVERIDAVEVRQAQSERAGTPAKVAPNVNERPSLKVVRVVPDDNSGMPSSQVGTPAPGDAADDPSPRPVIKLRGSDKSDSKRDGKGEG